MKKVLIWTASLTFVYEIQASAAIKGRIAREIVRSMSKKEGSAWHKKTENDSVDVIVDGIYGLGAVVGALVGGGYTAHSCIKDRSYIALPFATCFGMGVGALGGMVATPFVVVSSPILVPCILYHVYRSTLQKPKVND